MALAAVVVFRLVTVDLGPWRQESQGQAIEFAAPKGVAGKFVRLQLERPARVRWQGSELPGGPAREFDLPDLQNEGNRLSVDREPGRARLLITPRVFASSAERTPRGADVTIRNTLENTANVSVVVRNPGGTGGSSASATVGPGTTHTVEVAGPVPVGQIEVLVQKEEEAVEGQYQFLAGFDLTIRTGPGR